MVATSAPRTMSSANELQRLLAMHGYITKPNVAKVRKPHPGPSDAYRRSMDRLYRSSARPVWAAAEIDRTRTSDRLD